jgi:hypothetical protein
MSAADLFALALDYRSQAERSGNQAERLELHRIADIYSVLATMDIPLAVLSRLLS